MKEEEGDGEMKGWEGGREGGREKECEGRDVKVDIDERCEMGNV